MFLKLKHSAPERICKISYHILEQKYDYLFINVRTIDRPYNHFSFIIRLQKIPKIY